MMSERVRVESIAALLKFRASLCKLAAKVRIGVDEGEAEVQRTIFWVQQEQRNYWKRQGDQRAELVTRAKSALNRKKLQKTDLGSKFSYVEEEKALRAAQRRLEEAKRKLDNVRRWGRLLDEESFSYKSVSQGLSQIIEVDVPAALAQLDNMVAALEAYAATGAASEPVSTASPAEADMVEAFASVSRAAPPLDAAEAERIKKLRARTPPETVREAVPTSSPSIAGALSEAGIASITKVFAELDLPSSPTSDEELIVSAGGVWRHSRIYLERLKVTREGDSGWFAGFADDTENPGYEAAAVGDLLAQRKELAGVLSLPEGSLVVFDDAGLAAIFDGHDRLVWPEK